MMLHNGNSDLDRLFLCEGEDSMFQIYDDILTTEEACEALKIGYNTLYGLLNSGVLKGYKCGRTWRIPKISIEEFIMGSLKLEHSTL